MLTYAEKKHTTVAIRSREQNGCMPTCWQGWKGWVRSVMQALSAGLLVCVLVGGGRVTECRVRHVVGVFWRSLGGGEWDS